MITHIINVRVVDQIPKVLVVYVRNDARLQQLGKSESMYRVEHCIYS
jgi:hypothetical protein